MSISGGVARAGLRNRSKYRLRRNGSGLVIPGNVPRATKLPTHGRNMALRFHAQNSACPRRSGRSARSPCGRWYPIRDPGVLLDSRRDLAVQFPCTFNGLISQMLCSSHSRWQGHNGHLGFANRQVKFAAFCNFQRGIQCFGVFFETFFNLIRSFMNQASAGASASCEIVVIV